MHVYYAQIDENGICVGISDLSGPVHQNYLIEIESYDLTLLGKRYHNGTWVENQN